MHEIVLISTMLFFKNECAFIKWNRNWTYLSLSGDKILTVDAIGNLKF